MLKVLNSILIATLLVGAFVVYSLEYSIKNKEREIVQIDRKMVKVRETNSLLDAEWSKLTAPARLQRLAEQHLKMVPLKAEKVATAAQLVKMLPERPAIDPTATNKDPIAEMLRGLEQ